MSTALCHFAPRRSTTSIFNGPLPANPMCLHPSCQTCRLIRMCVPPQLIRRQPNFTSSTDCIATWRSAICYSMSKLLWRASLRMLQQSMLTRLPFTDRGLAWQRAFLIHLSRKRTARTRNLLRLPPPLPLHQELRCLQLPLQATRTSGNDCGPWLRTCLCLCVMCACVQVCVVCV